MVAFGLMLWIFLQNIIWICQKIRQIEGTTNFHEFFAISDFDGIFCYKRHFLVCTCVINTSMTSQHQCKFLSGLKTQNIIITGKIHLMFGFAFFNNGRSENINTFSCQFQRQFTFHAWAVACIEELDCKSIIDIHHDHSDMHSVRKHGTGLGKSAFVCTRKHFGHAQVFTFDQIEVDATSRWFEVDASRCMA